MKVLTPQQFATQTKVLPLKLEAALFKAKIDIGIMVVNLFQQTWQTQILPGGNNPWRPRSPRSTRKNQLMYDTGALYEGFSFELNETGVTVGNDVEYAKYHNDPDGSWYPNIQRQFLGTSGYIERQIHHRLWMAIKIATE